MEPPFDLVIDGKTKYYMRTCGTLRDIVANKIKDIYDCQYTEMVCSGMNSIYITIETAMEHVTDKNAIYLCSNELYCDTPKVFDHLIQKHPNIQMMLFNPNDSENLRKIIIEHKNDIKCFFTEACSNPKSYMIDWSILNLLSSSCVIIVDNTWLTGKIFNPFNYGAHIVVESCTKYLSNGMCIGGAISFKRIDDPISHAICKKIDYMGIHISPIHCQYISNGIDKLDDTLQKISLRTEELYNHLLTIPNIDHIMSSLNTNHPNYVIIKKYIVKYNVGVIYFHIRTVKFRTDKDWKKHIFECVKMNNITLETSFGKRYDLIDMWPKKDHDGIWLRLSIGSEERYPIKERLTNLVSAIS
jgi:cystathionine beta-lyase/cystathionine gamma-synthase